MSPELADKYNEALDTPLDPELLAAGAEVVRMYYATVEAGGNLESDSFEPRPATDKYARLDIATYPQFETEEAQDELIKGLGRDGLLAMLTHPEVGIMPNFLSEFVPAIQEMFTELKVVEAMKEGRPVILASDHDNWISTALLGVASAVALRKMGEKELAQKAALSIGFAAASFNKLEVMEIELDPLEAINTHVDIIKSFPNSWARKLIDVADDDHEEDVHEEEKEDDNDPVGNLNELARDAISEVLQDGGMLTVAISGTHDKEQSGSIVASEPGPGTARTLLSNETLALNPILIPCIALCNPLQTGKLKPENGKFHYAAGFEFSSNELSLHQRSQEFMTHIQELKVMSTRKTVHIKAHEDWGDGPAMPSMNLAEAIRHRMHRIPNSWRRKHKD